MEDKNKKLKDDIKTSGLQKSFLADKVDVSPAHFSMMLSGKATMPEPVRNKLNEILKQALQIA